MWKPEPLEGVIVVALLEGHVNPIADSTQICYHVETAMSDADGNFRIPGWIGGTFGVVGGYRSLVVYKMGFRRMPGDASDNVSMAPFQGNRAERIKYIQSLVTSCYAAEESRKNLLPLRRAIFEESEKLALTSEDHDIVEWFLTGIEEIMYGLNEAERRHFERLEAWK